MEREREDPSFGVARLDGGGDTIPPARTSSPPATIVNPNERLLKSDPPDISRSRGPGCGPWHGVEGGERGGGGGKKGRKPHRLSYNLCSHLKETLPGGTGSRIARTPRVWSAA